MRATLEEQERDGVLSPLTIILSLMVIMASDDGF